MYKIQATTSSAITVNLLVRLHFHSGLNYPVFQTAVLYEEPFVFFKHSFTNFRRTLSGKINSLHWLWIDTDVLYILKLPETWAHTSWGWRDTWWIMIFMQKTVEDVQLKQWICAIKALSTEVHASSLLVTDV